MTDIMKMLMIVMKLSFVIFRFVMFLQETPCPVNTVCVRISEGSRGTLCVGTSVSVLQDNFRNSSSLLFPVVFY